MPPKEDKLTVEEQTLLLCEETCTRLKSIELAINTGFKGLQEEQKQERKDHKDLTTKLITVIGGLALATIGVKFIGTPILVDLAVYLGILVGAFTASYLIFIWNEINWAQRITRIVMAAFLLSNAGLKVIYWHYLQGHMPVWFSGFTDAFLIILALCLFWATWHRPHKVTPKG